MTDWLNEKCACPIKIDECRESVAGKCIPKKCILSELYESKTTCVGCENFLRIDFGVDNALSFQGICLWAQTAIPNEKYGLENCPRHNKAIEK